MKRVYISGKVTGLTEEEFTKNFKDAEKKLKMLGYQPYNPVQHRTNGFNWEDYMKRDIQQLCECDYIYQLQNWEDSRGAKIEFELAKNLKIPLLKISMI